jgi:DmsE family decaheme c-type cytochrome
MNARKIIAWGAWVGCFLATSVAAADNPAPEETMAQKALARDKVCTVCHNESWRVPVLSLYQTRHGNRADPRAPNCQGCHGSSDAHQKDPGGAHPDVVFATRSKNVSSVDDRNTTCLTCHQTDSKRSHWMGSTHESRDVACVSCHQVHTAHDDVRDKHTQPDVCFTCHKEQRTQINKPSHHPIPEGKMGCSDCHNPHGSVGPKLMKRDSVNETCYTCHMEKRGPFVHTHEPVAEDCSNCHNPHGTTAENLLKARPPFLCHQCHTPHGGNIAQLRGQGQPSALLSGVTSGKSGINYTMARGCVNCHTQVHGTNNPSTTNPTPQFNFR